MYCPGVLRQPLEEVFIGAIVASCKDKVWIGVRGEETFDDFALVRPSGFDLDDFFTSERPQFRLSEHRLQHRDEFIGQPFAELRLGHPVVPDQTILFFFHKTAWRAVDEVLQYRHYGGLPV